MASSLVEPPLLNCYFATVFGQVCQFEVSSQNLSNFTIIYVHTVLAPLKVALEKEPLSINGRKNRAQKMFFEYKPLLNISRAILDFKINREAQFKIC